MTDTKLPDVSVRDSILAVLARIRQSAIGQGKTKLPTAEFSRALNSVGERFIDLLLQNECTGNWWLGENGEWLQCTVRSTGRRVTRHFYSGDTPETQLLSTSKHIADPLTGPDHIVSVFVPSLNLNSNVVLEQKLRFSTRQDAFADSGTYLKHLLYKSRYTSPKECDFDPDSYCNGLLTSLVNVMGTTMGRVGFIGTVPQVCFLLVSTPPNKIIIGDKESKKITKCDFVGFLPPIVATESFMKNSPASEIIRRAKVRLWIGLDSLLNVCEASEVEAAWNIAIKELSTDLHNPKWRIEAEVKNADEAEDI